MRTTATGLVRGRALTMALLLGAAAMAQIARLRNIALCKGGRGLLARSPDRGLHGADRPIRLTLATLYPRANFYRALITNPRAALSLDEARVYSRNLEVPSGGGVRTVRAIARAYAVFATGARELQLRPETLRLRRSPAEHGFYDECLNGEIRFSLGFAKPGPTSAFGHPGSFGHPGEGGSFGFADPEAGIGYAYVTNRLGTTLPFDPRDVALRNALSSIAI